MKNLTGRLENLDDTVGKVQRSIKQTSDSLSSWTRHFLSINQFTQAFNQLSSSLNDLAAPAADFNYAMRKMNTMAGLSEGEFSAMKKQVHELSREIPIAKDALANGLYQVISNGVPRDNWIDYLRASSRSAVGGCADLEKVVTVTSTVIKNYGLEWNKAVEIQDKIQLTAKNGVTSFEQLAEALPVVSGSASTLGVSVDELMASFATLTGVSGNTANVATQMGAVFNSLISPTTEAAKTAQMLGIEFNAAAIKSAGGLQQFLTNTVGVVQQYCQQTGALEAEVYGQLFGNARALRALIPLTGELATKYSENVGVMTASTGTMDAAFAQMDSTSQAWSQRMKNAFSGFSDAISGALGNIIPGLSKTVQIIGSLGSALPILKAFGNCFSFITPKIMASNIGLKIQDIILEGLIRKEQLMNRLNLRMAASTTLAGKAAIIAGVGFTAMKNMAVTACRSISAAIMAIPIVGWIAAGITAVVAAIKLLWDKCEGFRVLVMGVWEVVKAGAVFAWTLIKAFFAYIWLRITSFVDTVVGVFTTIKEAVGAAAQWVRDTIITPVVEWFNGVGDSVLSVVDRIRTATGGAFDWVRTKIFKPITDFFSNLYDNYVKPALDKIVGFMAKIFNPIIKLWNRLTGAAVEAFGTGAQKGHASWLADHSDGGASGGTNQSLAEAVNAPLRAATKGSGATGISNATAQGTEAVATGGSKQTTVNISLGKFFENIVYNEGGAADNASDTERRFVEIMNRVLGMAAMAV